MAVLVLQAFEVVVEDLVCVLAFACGVQLGGGLSLMTSALVAHRILIITNIFLNFAPFIVRHFLNPMIID